MREMTPENQHRGPESDKKPQATQQVYHRLNVFHCCVCSAYKLRYWTFIYVAIISHTK